MALPQTITGVTASRVGTVVKSFIDNEGATKVIATQERGKTTWKIVAS